MLAIIGCICSTICAYLVIYPTDLQEVENGLYGYNGVLVGGAMYTFLSAGGDAYTEPSLTNVGLGVTVILSCSAGVMHCSCINMNNLPALTLAFNIVTVGLFLSIARGTVYICKV